MIIVDSREDSRDGDIYKETWNITTMPIPIYTSGDPEAATVTGEILSKDGKLELRRACSSRVLTDSAAAAAEAVTEHPKYKNLNGEKETRPYQYDGVKFIEGTAFRCLIGDQQGLGKTIQILLALRENGARLPALVVVKSSTLWQWKQETNDWFSALPSSVWMIRSGKEWIPPGFSIYLISMDTLRAYVRPMQDVVGAKYMYGAKPDYIIDERLSFLGIKTVVADEIHSFKNTESKRSLALTEYIRLANIQNMVFLSGTPILNRASEYIVPLSLLDPKHFPSETHFRDNYLDYSGQRIAPSMLGYFKDRTSAYILRRERSQVLTDLPPFQRVFENVVIENETLKKHYNREVEAIRRKDSESGADLSYNAIKDNLMTMRRIVGKAKAEIIVDFVHDFMEQTENEKLCIGIHHREVRDMLATLLAEYRPVVLSGDDNSDRKQKLIETFQRPERRLAIFNVIAGGTGLNLQFCNNCIVLERQWSAGVEEQFEDRFNRYGQKLPVTAMYPRALKTVDEFFSNLVESKRQIFGETVALDFDSWMEAGNVRDVVDWIFAQGKI